jgi:hypothetical protein
MSASPTPDAFMTESAPTNVVQVGSQSVRLVAVPVGKSPIGEMLQSKKFLAMVYIGEQGVADAGQ